MASVFTFDPDPPRVASPWLDEYVTKQKPVTRLPAEPQEGPTEYKLHLLLRSRRSFVELSTGTRLSGVLRSTASTHPSTPRSMSEINLDQPVLAQASPIIHKQGRLQQLTTQLLWRLQQSSPNHATSYTSISVPEVLTAITDPAIQSLQRPIPGLEESQGALYEIGVADDGTFVGLAEDEMKESITNLRTMAASLGCHVTIVREVAVGSCEWLDDEGVLRKENLWVVEANVKPNTGMAPASNGSKQSGSHATQTPASKVAETSTATATVTNQMRISLTGATMSGKSSLLGSLTTATLDNGRGKSRLSLLKHRHEIISGMTSSVTQELIGYVAAPDGSEDVRIINYAIGNISSWVDLHAMSRSGRLCLLSDSAGHLRYRRSTLRGLIGWAPHWTLLCVPADNSEDTSGLNGSTPPPEELLGVPSVDVDLSEANLDLCLRLNLPLVIAVTKLDIVSRLGLRSCLSKILSALKSAGRRPLIMPDTPAAGADSSIDLIPANDIHAMAKLLDPLVEDPLSVVPIIMTSAVKGTGILKLHALMNTLPLPKVAVDRDETANKQAVFHIEDVYTGTAASSGQTNAVTVVSGHVKHGELHVGEQLFLGPFTRELPADELDSLVRPQVPTSRSFPGALPELAKFKGNPDRVAEWQRVKVVSIRELRLPVHTLYDDQVGTVGIALVEENPTGSDLLAQVRKGMVLAKDCPVACSSFEAVFARSDVDGLSIRSNVVIYTASVRASARIIGGAVVESTALQQPTSHATDYNKEDGLFSLDDADDLSQPEQANGNGADHQLAVTLQFLASREYVEPGAQIMIMPGGGPGLFGGSERGEKGMASLEGYVGKILRVLS